MKLLIISNTPWDNANSFGNTFTNLFFKMPDVEIYNICCRDGKQNNQVVKRAVQFTDKRVLKSIYKVNFDPCVEMNMVTHNVEEKDDMFSYATKTRRPIFFWVRHLIWLLSNYSKSKKLNSFLEEINPDLIYLPVYAIPHISNLQSYIIKKLNVPVVGHISDDVCGIPPTSNIIIKLYRTLAKKKAEGIIKRCNYLEVFAENMAEEYEKRYNRKCYLIGKGIDTSTIKPEELAVDASKQLNFVYTGNLSAERFETLINLSKALKNNAAVLNVYSATPLSVDMSNQIASLDNICFHGKIDKTQVEQVQNDADFLVHVEGFSKQAIYDAKMSFSTKIMDYMQKNKPIFAIGDIAINSIRVLKDHELAVVATKQEEIGEKVNQIFTDVINYKSIQDNIYNFLIDRDIVKIQEEMLNRMKNLI